MGANTNEIVTRLVTNNKQFDGAMNGSIQVMERFNKKGELIGSSVKVLTKHLDDAKSKTDEFRVAMTRLSRDIKVANTIFHTLAGGIERAYEAASEGAKIMAAEQFFKNAGKSIAEYRKATNGMVSDAELMKKANLADSMGIDEATFKQLVMVAEAASLKTGQSFEYMFNSIIVGTARSSRLLLDNLGIIVSIKQANEKYAASIGKVVEELSAEEKQIAFVQEVRRKSAGMVDEYNSTVDRTAESFARLDASVVNFSNTLKVTLAKAMTGAVKETGSFVTDLNTIFESLDPNWTAPMTTAWNAAVDGMWSAFNTMLGGIPGALSDALSNAKAVVGFTAKHTETGAKNRAFEQRRKAFEETNEAMKELMALPEMVGKAWTDAARDYLEYGTTGLSAAVDDAIGIFLELNKVSKAFVDIVARAETTTFQPTVKAGGKQKEAKAIKLNESKLFDTIQRGLLKLDERQFAEAGRALAAPFDKSVAKFNDGSDRLDSYMKDWNKRWIKATEEYIQYLVERSAPIGGAVTQVGTGGGLFGPVVGAITSLAGGVSGITGALVGMGTGAAAGPLGAVIGAVIPLIMNIIDGLKPVVDIINAIMIGLELLVKNGLGELLRPLAMLAKPIQDLLAALGVLVGSALRPIVVIFTLLVGIVSVVVQAFALVITALSPFIEMLVWFLAAWVTGGGAIVAMFFDLNIAVGNLMAGFNWATNTMLNSAIAFNNAIVKFMRNTLKMKGFGKYLDREDFRGGGDPIDENTSAVAENTRALRDFAREFRNLPQGYKGDGAVYAAQDPQREWRGPRRLNGIGSRPVEGLQNVRWRT